MINTASESRQFEFGDFRLDIANHSLSKDGSRIQITQKSFEILRLFVENPGRILTKQEILDEVWTESFVEEATLTQHIYMVRKALRNESGGTDFIETVPKYGYRFKAEVRELEPDERRTRSEMRDSARASISTSYSISEFRLDSNGRAKTYTKPKMRKKVLLTGAAGAMLLAIAGYFLLPAPVEEGKLSEIRSIAVVPFDQIGEPKDERLGIGLADSLIGRLSEDESVPVSPTSEVAGYSRNGVGSVDIGRKLGVEAVLTGTIQRQGERVRINVQLVSVDRNVPVWTHSFDSDFHDAFSLQDAAAEIIADRLSEGFGHRQGAVLAERGHTKPDSASTSKAASGPGPAPETQGP